MTSKATQGYQPLQAQRHMLLHIASFSYHETAKRQCWVLFGREPILATMNIVPVPRCRFQALIAPRTWIRNVVYELTGPRESHGEKIWIFDHLLSKQVVYSFSSLLDVRLNAFYLPKLYVAGQCIGQDRR